MSQNLSEYLSRRANGNGGSKAKAAGSNYDDTKKVQGSAVSDHEKNYQKTSSTDNWDSLEVIIQNYEQFKPLPPLLSPILPEIYGGDVSKVDIPKMLSPTLPDIYNENNGKDIKQPVPQRSKALKGDQEDRSQESGDYELIDGSPVKPKRNMVDQIPKPTKRRSFEKIEHFGVHSYKLIETSNKKSLLLTLHVPKYYKNKKQKTSKQSQSQSQSQSQHDKTQDKAPLGLGIRRNGEKNDKPTHSEQKVKKPSIFKGAVKESSATSSSNIGGGGGGNSSNNGTSSRESLDHGELIAKNERYLKIAKDKKHKGDGMRKQDLKLSITYFMDSLIVFLVGFNYEDQSRRLLKKLYNDKNWLSLISLIDHVLRICTDNEIMDIAGLCLQIKVVVYEHVCKILDEFIQLNNVKRKKAKTDEEILKIDDNLNNHFKNYSKYKELCKKSLIQSERYLPIFKIQKKYPSIIEFYEKQPDRNRLFKDPVYILEPSTDNIHLPINSTVTLKEMCAYSLKVVKKWCQDENVKYNEWTF